MRNLHTYDMFLLEYKKATRTQKMSLEEAVDFYNKNCNDWNLISKKQIYRGSLSSPSVFYINPEGGHGERHSANTYGMYNKIFSVSESWSKAPDRTKSLIMSTNAMTAGTFGDDEYYIMIPTNGSKIGMCSKDDIWASFPYIRSLQEDKWYTLEDFDGEIHDFLASNVDEKYLSYSKYGLNNEKTRINFKNWDRDFYEMVDSIDKMDKSKFNMNWSYSTDHTYKLITVWVDDFPQMKFIDFLKDMLDFDKNDFEIINSQKELEENREVWSSDSFIGIHEGYFEKFKEMVKNS